MDNIEAADKLSSLMKLDIDAVKAYEKALENIDNREVYDEIAKYRDDHVRHVDVLTHMIRDLGSVPPKRTTDIRGLFLTGASMLMGISGTSGALKALQTGEKMTNKSYENATNQPFPKEIRNRLESFFLDEQRHLRYITHALDMKIWEKPA
ncbi:MAG: ferritin-like domain-containing protein [Fibrobacter sp.]|nr:ferritin-like domain-containing protein [Fibrobacter sp.]